MTPWAFGLDIGGTNMKAVWLSYDKGQYSLNASFIAPTPKGGMLSESPFDQEQMASSIKKMVDDAQITSKYVNIALPEHEVYTKVIEMPVLSDKELASAIYWEAEQQIPVPLTTVNLTWSVLRRPERAQTEEKMQVLLVGAPTRLIEKYKKIISMAGLTIPVMETEILSTLRAIVTSADFPPTIIINIGAVSTFLAIVKNGTMIFAYSIPSGGMAINRAISADFGLTPLQAEEYKKTYGIADKAIGFKIGKSTEPILMSILSEVKKALSFYSQKYTDIPIQQIILSGGTAKLAGIDLFFTSNTNIQTAVANPWKILANQNIPKEILEYGADFTTAVGLALRHE